VVARPLDLAKDSPKSRRATSNCASDHAVELEERLDARLVEVVLGGPRFSE
jgi:hypothetical protein